MWKLKDRDNRFQIDNVTMPKPDVWQVNPKPMSKGAKRLVGTGKAVVNYLTTAYEIIWTYKTLKAEDYDALYEAYIQNTIDRKNFYHTLKTADSNSDGTKTLEIYTQGDFVAPLYWIKDGERLYRDITFTFISLGGEE